MSKAFIQKPAPDFEATAVTEKGEFKTVKLSDYKGMILCFCFIYSRLLNSDRDFLSKSFLFTFSGF